MRVSSLNICLRATVSRCAVLIPQVLLQPTIHDGSQVLLKDIVILAARNLWRRKAGKNHLCCLGARIECGLMTSTLTMTFLFVFPTSILFSLYFSYLVRSNHYALAELSQRLFLAHPVLFFGTWSHPMWFLRAL